MAGTRDHGPGAVRVREGTRVLNHRSTADGIGSVTIENTGDRPVQIGSHIHLPDVNAALSFDRRGVRGFRLDVPSGTSIRFEPGASRTVPIVRFGGKGIVPGLQIRRGERPEPGNAEDSAGHGADRAAGPEDTGPVDSGPEDSGAGAD